MLQWKIQKSNYHWYRIKIPDISNKGSEIPAHLIIQNMDYKVKGALKTGAKYYMWSTNFHMYLSPNIYVDSM